MAYTLANLFEAAEKKSTNEIATIIHSKEVDLNGFYNGKHIIDYILDLPKISAHQVKEIITLLATAGAFPPANSVENLLLKLACLGKNDHKFCEMIASKFAEDAGWVKIYGMNPIHALRGEIPAFKELLIPDLFGLLPVHYAFCANRADEDWLWGHAYNFTQPIVQGILAGTNLLWFMAQNTSLTPIFFYTVQVSDVQQRYRLAITAPINPNSSACGLSIAWWLIKNDLDWFNKLIQGFETLSVADRFALLSLSILNPENILHSSSVGLALLEEKQLETFDLLSQGFDATLPIEHRFNFMTSHLASNAPNSHRPSVGYHLLRNNRIDKIKALTSDFNTLSAEKRFRYLSARFIRQDTLENNSPEVQDDLSVAGFYMLHDMHYELVELMNDFDADQCIDILLSVALSDDKTTKTTVLHKLYPVYPEIIRKVFDECNMNNLVELYKKTDSNSAEHALVCHLYLTQLITHLTASLALPNMQNDKLLEQLVKIIALQQKIIATDHKSCSFELMGMLLREAIKSQYKSVFNDFFVNNPQSSFYTSKGEDIFARVTEVTPGYGLEGLAQFCLFSGFGGSFELSDIIMHVHSSQNIDKLRARKADLTAPNPTAESSNKKVKTPTTATSLPVGVLHRIA